EVERKAREISVFSLAEVQLQGDTLSFVTQVSKGTYIRNLVDDLGEKLGCGAHVTFLRRLQAGPFSQMVTLEMLELAREKGTLNDLLLPLQAALVGFAEVDLDAALAQRFQFGQRFKVAHPPGMVTVYGPEKKLLGIAEVLADGLLVAHRLMKTN
ncbi:MAG TPA: tRNA pseudouridine(55) synthase TruB, partial [Pseudomonadales bacterium]|nr:tRNA pseudouridine(55) synthase TruB [Pseudomonadales bacterium]